MTFAFAADFTGAGWRDQRQAFGVAVQRVRSTGLVEISSRRGAVPPELKEAWDELLLVLEEIEQRRLPRELDLWRRLVRSILRTARAAEDAEELCFADAVFQLRAPAVLFFGAAHQDEQRKREQLARIEHRRPSSLIRSKRMSRDLWTPDGPNLVVEADNAAVLPVLPDAAFTMIYIDPPFNTGRAQRRETLKTVRSETGTRVGFKGQTYEAVRERVLSFDDEFSDYWGFLEPRLEHAWRLLTEDGTLYLHLDYREVHYAKVLLDALFGRECFLNEIIWAYDYGARSKRKWPAKHDNILVYVKSPSAYYYDGEAVDREPYMAPGLVTAEKAARGKLPTDCWWHTIVSPTGKEKTGYPTQKPQGVLRRIVQASTRSGDWVLDFFAGSGTLGAVAQELDRRFVLIDKHPEAMRVMKQRLSSPARIAPGSIEFFDASDAIAS